MSPSNKPVIITLFVDYQVKLYRRDFSNAMKDTTDENL